MAFAADAGHNAHAATNPTATRSALRGRETGTRPTAAPAFRVRLGRSAKAPIKLAAGLLAPSGTALISGKLPAAHKSPPKAYLLSQQSSFVPTSVGLSMTSVKAPKGTYRAWVALPDEIATGKWTLIACSKATPTKASCFAVGTAHVVAAPVPVMATPVLETGRSGSRVYQDKTTPLKVKAKDGTTFTLTIPASDATFPVQMTPVSAFTPTKALGTFVDGVMITPLGEAPPGATLVIKPAKQPSAKAEIVGFGGIDPSGAAYPLPIPFGKTAKIPLASFGGYGIAVPGGGTSKVKPACASSQAGSAGHIRPADVQPGAADCLSCAERLEQLAAALNSRLAQERQAQLSGGQSTSSIATIIASATSALDAVDQETQSVLSQPESDQGEGELEVLAIETTDLGRQLQLLGDPDSDARVRQLLDDGSEYRLKNIKRACNSSTPQSAASLMAHAFQAFAAARTFGRFDDTAGFDEALALRDKCLLRVKINLDVTDTSEFDNTELDVTADVSASGILITGQEDSGHAVLKAPATNLTYNSESVSVDPPWSMIETADFTSETGTVTTPVSGYSASTDVKCVNKKLVVSYVADIYLAPQDVWKDVQKVQVSEDATVIGTDSGTTEASAWDAGVTAGSVETPLEIPLDPKTTPEFKGHGACSLGCTSYSYDATFNATGRNN